MYTNGRSIYHLQTRDKTRAQKWQRLFGLDALPVLSNRARWQPLNNGRMTYAFDLALSELSQAQRNAFSGYIARRTKRPYDQVKREMDTSTSWPLAANGCRVVVIESEEEATAAPQLPPLLSFGRSQAARLRLAAG